MPQHTDLQFQRFQNQVPTRLLPSLLSQIASYRQTTYTLRDFEAESKSPLMRYNWMLGPADTVIAFCKTEETIKTNALYISSFLIHPTHRGLGLGGTFLSKMLEEAPRYSKVLLKVHEDNPIAKRLYETHGFQMKQKWNKRYEMEYLG